MEICKNRPSEPMIYIGGAEEPEAEAEGCLSKEPWVARVAILLWFGNSPLSLTMKL